MSPEEYLEEVKALEEEFATKKSRLNKKYVSSNNKHRVGDAVTDHLGTILVQELLLGFPTGDKVPCAVYKGLPLNKDGSVKKKVDRRLVWQTNLIKV